MTKISNQYSLTNILTADLANSRLGINNVSPAYSLDLTGTARVTSSFYLPSLTTNYIPKIGTSGLLGNSVIYDDGTSIGIGTTTNLNFGVAGTVGISVGGSSAYSGIQLRNTTGNLELFVGGDGATDAFIRNNMNGNLRFGTNGNEKMRINAIGNIGVGVIPTTWGSIFRAIQVGISGSIVSTLTTGETDIALYSNTYYDGTNYKILNSTTQVPSFFQLADGSLQLNSGNTGSVGSNVTGLTTKFLITKTGRVLIGTTTDNTYSALQVVGSTWLGADVGAGLFINSTSTLTSLVGINKAVSAYAKMELRASGTDGQICLHTNGNNSMGTLTDGGYRLYVNGTAAGTSGFANVSDRRLKKDITPIESALNKVKLLNGVSFNWDKTSRPDLALDDKNHLGLIAQDVEEILPQVVSTGIDELNTKTIIYSDIVPVLIEAIKELSAKVSLLENK